jgi:CBS domain-containing protein/CheY-specific phosphatase CheX
MGLMNTALKEITAENIGTYMTSTVITISQDSTLRDFLKLLNENKISSLIVTENDRYVGIVTKRDFIRKAINQRKDPETTKVSEIMTSPMLTMERSTSVEDARNFMMKNKIRHLPVMEENRIIGMISIKDTMRKSVDQKLIDAFLKSTGEAIQNFMLDASPLPPTESDDLPGEISAVIKLTDEAKNVEIMIILNFSEEVAQKVYQGLFGEESNSMKDICNVVTEISNIIAGNVKVEISHFVQEILSLTHSEKTSSDAKGIFHFDVGLPTTVIGSGHSVSGVEKLSTAKTFIPYVNEGNPMFLLGLIFQKKEES